MSRPSVVSSPKPVPVGRRRVCAYRAHSRDSVALIPPGYNHAANTYSVAANTSTSVKPMWIASNVASTALTTEAHALTAQAQGTSARSSAHTVRIANGNGIPVTKPSGKIRPPQPRYVRDRSARRPRAEATAARQRRRASSQRSQGRAVPRCGAAGQSLRTAAPTSG